MKKFLEKRNKNKKYKGRNFGEKSEEVKTFGINEQPENIDFNVSFSSAFGKSGAPNRAGIFRIIIGRV